MKTKMTWREWKRRFVFSFVRLCDVGRAIAEDAAEGFRHDDWREMIPEDNAEAEASYWREQ